MASASTLPGDLNAFQIATSSRQVSMTHGQHDDPQHSYASQRLTLDGGVHAQMSRL